MLDCGRKAGRFDSSQLASTSSSSRVATSVGFFALPGRWVDIKEARTLYSLLRALTTRLRWSNHEGHEDGIRRSAESNERLCDRGSRAPRAGTTTWHRTLLSLIPSCSSCASCASWSTDRPAPLACHGHIPRPWRTSRCTRAGESFGFEREGHVRPPGDLGRSPLKT